MDITLEEFKQLLLILLGHKVNFMLIGGYAVIYYGYERTTSDLDIWLEPENENRDRLVLALEEFGIDNESLDALAASDFTQIQFFFFGEKPARIDFLTRISNVTYKDAAQEVNYLPLKDKQVPIIHYRHLILSKIANDRARDKADVEELQKININRKNPF